MKEEIDTKEWMRTENERRKRMQEEQAKLNEIQKEKQKYPKIDRNDVMVHKICSNEKCGNVFNVIIENEKYMVTGRHKFEEKQCPCGKSLELSKTDIDKLKQPKKLMYSGFTGNNEAFEHQGVRFRPRVVYNVDRDVYRYFKEIRKMVEVEGISAETLHFPNPNDNIISAHNAHVLSGIGVMV